MVFVNLTLIQFLLVAIARYTKTLIYYLYKRAKAGYFVELQRFICMYLEYFREREQWYCVISTRKHLLGKWTQENVDIKDNNMRRSRCNSNSMIQCSMMFVLDRDPIERNPLV
jgi:hypothetical protein